MERMAVFILFLIINLAGVGTAGLPPEHGIKPEAKVTATRAMVMEDTTQAGPFWLAGVEAAGDNSSSQG